MTEAVDIMVETEAPVELEQQEETKVDKESPPKCLVLSKWRSKTETTIEEL